MRFISWFRASFSTPARQAVLWTGLGITGLALAAGGIWFATGDSEDPPRAALPETSTTSTSSPTATRTRTPSPTLTATATPAPTETPTFAPTPRSQASTGNTQPVPEPTAEPTPEPVVAGGPYCNNISSSTPPNSIFGLLTIAGTPAPAGTSVTVLFDGMSGPSITTPEAGGYKINWSAGGSECANRVGATVAVLVNGQVFTSGFTVGGGGGTPVIRFDVAIP